MQSFCHVAAVNVETLYELPTFIVSWGCVLRLGAGVNHSWPNSVLEIDLADIKEPIVCCPNDPDDAKFVSEVFVGSCVTNIGHLRAAGEILKDKNTQVFLG